MTSTRPISRKEPVMSDFVILTDSSADLTAELAAQLQVAVLPLSFTLRDQIYYNYPDNREMDPKAFYDLLRQGETATTSAINVSQYTDVLEPLLQAGKDVLILAFSSGLSTTYNSGVIAANDLRERYPERKVYVVDTLCASLGQGLLVYLCSRKHMDGLSLDEVYAYATETAPKIAHWVTVDDLFHLKRGGRVSAATAVVGSMLSIKPIIHVDDEGRLINVGKARGRKPSLLTLAEECEKRLLDPSLPVFISHGDCEEDAKFVAEEVHKRTGAETKLITYVGPVIGSHTGAGVIALCFVGKER